MTERVGLGQLRDYFPQQRMSTYILPLPDHDLLSVKNPKAALHAYLDKLVAKAPRWHARVQSALGVPVDLDAEISFEEFVSAIERQDPVGEMDPHWRPQHVNLMHPVISYDLVGRVETFDADLELYGY